MTALVCVIAVGSVFDIAGGRIAGDEGGVGVAEAVGVGIKVEGAGVGWIFVNRPVAVLVCTVAKLGRTRKAERVVVVTVLALGNPVGIGGRAGGGEGGRGAKSVAIQVEVEGAIGAFFVDGAVAVVIFSVT